MKLAEVPPWVLGAFALAGVAWWLTRKGNAAAAGQAVGAAVVDAGAGVVVGIGQAVGIPQTSASQCRADLDAGRLWDASFSCPAGDFLGALLDRADGSSGSVSGGW